MRLFSWLFYMKDSLEAAGFATASLAGKQKRAHRNVLLCWYRGSLIREIGRNSVHAASMLVAVRRAHSDDVRMLLWGAHQKYAPTLARSHEQCWSHHGVTAALCADTTATRLY